MLSIDQLKANISPDVLGYVPKYAWVGVPCNAWEDNVWDILPINVIQNDINLKTDQIASGEASNYGQLDIMHRHSLTIGDWQVRTIIEGTRMELGAGFIYPQFNNLASELVGKTLTMSIEFNCMISDPLSKQKSVSRREAEELITMKKSYDIVMIDVYRATIARVGAEANSRTIVKIVAI